MRERDLVAKLTQLLRQKVWVVTDISGAFISEPL
jgi:hypothetical protein